MNTVFLMDASGRTSLTMNAAVARYIVRAFRPGDIVLCFDYRTLLVGFRGNPTFNDIMNLALGMSGPCSGFEQALIDANRIIPGCRKIVLGGGTWETLLATFSYEEILFNCAGRRK